MKHRMLSRCISSSLVLLCFVVAGSVSFAQSGVKSAAKTQLTKAKAKTPPNILFISMDDLNDWIGCLGGHPQARTPNIDRLADSGMLFSNAHCSSPSCNPSRTAIMTGRPCYKTGLYDNRQRMRNKLPDAEIIPKYFSRNGYWSAGSGKILHYFIDADSWDDYYPPKETENPFPNTLYPGKRPVSLTRGGDWQYIETDWGPLDVTDEEFGGDWLVSKWIGDQLAKPHDKPFLTLMICLNPARKLARSRTFNTFKKKTNGGKAFRDTWLRLRLRTRWLAGCWMRWSVVLIETIRSWFCGATTVGILVKKSNGRSTRLGEFVRECR